MSSLPDRRDPWARWDVLTTPMSETEAHLVADYIETRLDDVDAVVVSPGQKLRLVWERQSVELFLDALSAYRAAGGTVPAVITDNLEHWLTHIADAPD